MSPFPVIGNDGVLGPYGLYFFGVVSLGAEDCGVVINGGRGVGENMCWKANFLGEIVL